MVFLTTFMIVSQMKSPWYLKALPKSSAGLLQMFELVSWKSLVEKGGWHPQSLWGGTDFLSLPETSRTDVVAYLPSLPSRATVPYLYCVWEGVWVPCLQTLMAPFPSASPEFPTQWELWVYDLTGPDGEVLPSAVRSLSFLQNSIT